MSSCGCDISSAGDVRHRCRLHAAQLRAANNPPRPVALEYPPLRDYFATAALSVMTGEWDRGVQLEELAESAYLIADAMLVAREKEPRK